MARHSLVYSSNIVSILNGPPSDVLSLFYDSSLPKTGSRNNLRVRIVSSRKVSAFGCGKIMFGRPQQQGCAHFGVDYPAL